MVSYIGSWTILAFWFLVSSNKCFMLSLCLWKGMILSLSNEKDFSSFGSSFSRLPASNRLLFLNPYIGSYCTPHFRIGNFYSFCPYLNACILVMFNFTIYNWLKSWNPICLDPNVSKSPSLSSIGNKNVLIYHSAYLDFCKNLCLTYLNQNVSFL